MAKISNHRPSRSKVRAASQQKRRFPFSEKTRLFDLTKASQHTTLAKWLDEIRPYLAGGELPDWKRATRLDFNCTHRMDVIAGCIATFLRAIGKDGLKCKKSVFFRYLTSSEHSNIPVPEGQLKTLVNNQLRDGLLPCN